MTYIQDDSGNEIVLSEDISITKQVLTFFNFKIKGNFSTNFTIPNTSVNRKALNYYGVNQSDKVAFSDQPWTLLKNGNVYDRGFLVIQGETEDELDCFFASGNASWIPVFTGNVRELNWSDYDQTFSQTNLNTLATATTGMIFSVADWGYQWQKNFPQINAVIPAYDNKKIDTSFIYDLYPSFYLKTIVNEIAKQKQIKVTGNIFDDPVFDKMVIPLETIERYLKAPVYMTDDDSYGGRQYIGAGATSTVTFAYASDTTASSYLTLSTGRITAKDRSVNLRVRISFLFESAFSGEVYLRKNGATINTYTFSVASFLRYQTVSLAAGDYLDVQVKNSGGTTHSITDKYFGYEVCGSWYEPSLKILASDVVPNTSIIEVIKYVVQAFNCVVSFDDFSRTITLNKLDSIRKENALDLSEKVNKYEVKWTNGFAKTNYIRTSQFADLDQFNTNELKFGEFSFDGPDNGQSKDDVFQLKFGPSLMGRTNNSKYNLCIPYIPLFTLEDEGDPLTYSSVTDSSEYCQFNGLSEALSTQTMVRVEDDNKLHNGFGMVISSTATTATVRNLFRATSTGKIFKQRITFNISAGFRVLVTNPNYLLTNIHNGTSWRYQTALLTTVETTNQHFATYYVDTNAFGYSSDLKLGAHPGPINNAVSIPLANQYYKTLQKIARNPVLNVQMKLSETEFNNLDLSEFIYLDIGKWSGYFLCQKIPNYKDGQSNLKLELLKVD